MRTAILTALAIVMLALTTADAAQRCRTTRSGSTTYTTCKNPEKRFRSHRMGSTTYTSCDR
jgi:hypothetical protein